MTNTEWPPKSWAPFAKDIAEADAWYSGDEERLAGLYGGISSTVRNTGFRRFWGATTTKTEPRRDGRLHVPAAADIATVSADLLFGEPPAWSIPEAHGDEPDPLAVAAEERLGEIALADGWASTLLEAGEIASGLSGVFLRPIWDESLAKHPILTVVHPDVAVPEFRYGVLVAVTFWRTLEGGGNGEVWRLLERYEPGSIEYGLYCGAREKLGRRCSLMDREETAVFWRADDELGGRVDLKSMGIEGLLPRYVPNALPNRKRRTQPIGRADTAGVEQLMDALDEAWSSWVRDLRLAKARLIVPDEFLTRPDGRGGGAYFDTDQEVFSPLSIDPTAMDKAGITPVQFAIRVAEHEQTCRALFTEICQAAGYSPQSFGLPGDGSTQTATEVNARTSRSEATTARKQGYWQRALEDVGESVLAIDRAIFGSGVTVFRPSVEFPGAAEADMRDTASTLNLLNLAGAASTETKVRLLHPEWENTMVQAEVERIMAEDAVQVDDPTGFAA